MDHTGNSAPVVIHARFEIWRWEDTQTYCGRLHGAEMDGIHLIRNPVKYELPTPSIKEVMLQYRFGGAI